MPRARVDLWFHEPRRGFFVVRAGTELELERDVPILLRDHAAKVERVEGRRLVACRIAGRPRLVAAEALER